MSKKLDEWLNDFVEKGFNPQDLLNWPDEGGGGTSKVKTVKTGQKIRIDLSQYSAPIYHYEDLHNIRRCLFAATPVLQNDFGPTFTYDDYNSIIMIDNSNAYYISMIINKSRTQILCQAGVWDYTDSGIKYDSLMPTTVIYESEEPIPSGDGGVVPQEIVDLFPTIEIEVPEVIVGTALYIEYEGDKMPFELID